jgi:hypothetical protein
MIAKIFLGNSHRPTQTYTDNIISSGDAARGKTVCPAGNTV